MSNVDLPVHELLLAAANSNEKASLLLQVLYLSNEAVYRRALLHVASLPPGECAELCELLDGRFPLSIEMSDTGSIALI